MGQSCPWDFSTPGNGVSWWQVKKQLEIWGGGDGFFLFYLEEVLSPQCPHSQLHSQLGYLAQPGKLSEFWGFLSFHKAIKAVLCLPCEGFSLLVTFGAVLPLIPPPFPGGRCLLPSQPAELRERKMWILFTEPRCPDIPEPHKHPSPKAKICHQTGIPHSCSPSQHQGKYVWVQGRGKAPAAKVDLSLNSQICLKMRILGEAERKAK